MQPQCIVAHVFTLSFLLTCHGRQQETTTEEVEFDLKVVEDILDNEPLIA